jgi:CBS domain-containing protein
MTIEAISQHKVVVVSRQATLKEVAQEMKQHNVGAIVIVKDREADKTPCGIITDRDIMMHLLESDSHNLQSPAKDVMSTPLLTVRKEQGISEVISAMTEKGVRRAPVVDEQNKVIGMIAIDDLVQLLASELKSLSNLIHRQIEAV